MARRPARAPAKPTVSRTAPCACPDCFLVTALALLLIGYSLFSALTLALTHFRREAYAEQALSRAMGLLLLAALAMLQGSHFAWIYGDLPWVEQPFYRLSLFAVAPAFYLFSAPLLRPGNQSPWHPALLLHALPLAAAPALAPVTALPLAFVLGAGYLAWLGRSLYALRGERSHFRLEMLLLGVVFGIAIGVSLLGLVHTALPARRFFEIYSIAIGAAFCLVHITLGLRPQLAIEVRESVQAAYANSTLTQVDCEAVLLHLDNLMSTVRRYADPELSLPTLAEELGLSSHQLSELINSRLGKGFSRYLREQRIAAAKAMLLAEPATSVLAVGLNVGFSSQSNFYEAFREIEGMTPGQFRKLKNRQATG
jgi:AraC-like DNA-binding protein